MGTIPTPIPAIWTNLGHRPANTPDGMPTQKEEALAPQKSNNVEDAGWEIELAAVPRSLFVPELIWLDRKDGYVSLTKSQDPIQWQELVEADLPIVTQVDDGETKVHEIGQLPTSSSSQPSIVKDMLIALDIHAGMNVLEIGAGTGWNTALLAERVGQDSVVSIEVDEKLAANARESLRKNGYEPTVIAGDGALGYPERAPYDRVLATCSVLQVPYSWVAQTKPGGLIVTPLATAYCNGVMAVLQVDKDGTASGHCQGNLAFMKLRAQRLPDWPGNAEQVNPVATVTDTTFADLREMIGPLSSVFPIGLKVRNCQLCWERGDDELVVEFYDHETQSWASVTVTRDSPAMVVRQQGPRQLWDEVEAAHQWWVGEGRPPVERFGLTVTPSGQYAWLNTPDNVISS